MPIVVEKLSYTYMKGSAISFQALTDISLTVNEGETLGIIGHTGSGKSTFVQHLNGLLQPASGFVTVDGYRMADKKERVLGRRLVGMVFQYPEYQLFEETVIKDVCFGPLSMGMPADEALKRSAEAMTLVGLSPDRFRDKSPFELSGGEKRRAALAGIIAMRPKYLVMDEPMAGLDPIGRREILSLIASLKSAIGCAVVMVSHSMDDVALCSDRIAVLSNGRLFACATPKEVFADADKLLSIGLDIPQASRLALLLQRRGILAPSGVFSMDDLYDYIKGELRHV